MVSIISQPEKNEIEQHLLETRCNALAVVYLGVRRSDRFLLVLQGDTKLAIYGLGFMREERLARAFQMPGQVCSPYNCIHSVQICSLLHDNREIQVSQLMCDL